MNISLNTKVVAIVGGIVAAGAAISGGYIAYSNYKVAEAKKAAEIAYANRPILTEACIMNGYGKGHCSFTNSGKTTGAKCGVITVNGPGVVTSDQFCSGQVAPMSTEKVEFNIPAVDELCDNGFEDWSDKCSFTFTESGMGGGQTQGV
jgi:hypothetical protein